MSIDTTNNSNNRADGTADSLNSLSGILNDQKRHRLIIQATLAPVAGQTRFQPAGFPEIGHVIYDAPQADGTKSKVCIVDSAASMANHLETVCVDRFGLNLVPELDGLPYIRCLTDKEEKENEKELVVTTFSEGHRLASSYFLNGFKDEDGVRILFGEKLRNEFGFRDIGKRSHPLPSDWWNVFKTIFKYDPNSLVHGILFPAMGIKIPRVLTANLEAFGAARVGSSGVKFDKLLMTNSGQPIFSKDEETAKEIQATFVIDLSLIRSLGRDTNGLSPAQKELLLGLSLWKIGKLLESPFRYRSNCDLELQSLKIDGEEEKNADIFSIKIDELIRAVNFPQNPVTSVYWPSNELFKKAKEKKDVPEDGASTEDSEENEEDNDTSNSTETE